MRRFLRLVAIISILLSLLSGHLAITQAEDAGSGDTGTPAASETLPDTSGTSDSVSDTESAALQSTEAPEPEPVYTQEPADVPTDPPAPVTEEESTIAPVVTEVPPTDVPATEIPATEVPATEVAASPSPDTGVDTDGDGLSDARELELGTDPALADTDGDGVNDGAEVAAGTDPLVANPAASPEASNVQGIVILATEGCDSAHVPVHVAGLTGATLTSPNPQGSAYHTLTFNLTFAVPNSSQTGDFFSVILDPALAWVNLPGFPISDSLGNTVATGTVSGGILTVTLSSYVCDKDNITGSVAVGAMWNVPTNVDGTDQVLHFKDTLGESFPVPVTVPGIPVDPTAGQFNKSGRWTNPAEQDYLGIGGALTWVLSARTAPAGGWGLVTFQDAAGPGWVIDCGSLSINHSYLTLNVASCSTASFSVSVANVRAGHQARLTFTASLTAIGLPGPFLNQSASITADGITRNPTAAVRRQNGTGNGQGDFVRIPDAPSSTAGACSGHTFTPPVVNVPANQPGLTYSLSPSPIPPTGGPYTITASLDPGYVWADISTWPAGWVLVNASTATFTSTIEGVPCTPAILAVPVVTQGTCTDGVITAPSVTLATTPGITYTKVGNEVPGGTVTVTATLADGYSWNVSAPWTVVDDTTATLVIHLDPVSCTEVTVTPPPTTPTTPPTTTPPATTPPATSPPGDATPISGLPVTGAPAMPQETTSILLLLIAALFMAGAGATLRRHSRDH